MDVTTLSRRLRAFARERDWEQFHSPKNLGGRASAVAGQRNDRDGASDREAAPGPRNHRRWSAGLIVRESEIQ